MENFSFRKNGDIQILICKPLEDIGFINGFSTRGGGVSPMPADSLSLGNLTQDTRDNVFENRRRFQAVLGASDFKLVTAKQVHSGDICIIDDMNEANAEPSTCDGIVSDIDGVLLAALTADCLPVLIADKKNGVFAAVHAGWRGTYAGIVRNAVTSMQMLFGSRPADIHAALGPAIRHCCFQVGPEVISKFQAKYDYISELLSKHVDDGKANLDINKANVHQLLDSGLLMENIYDSRFCTVCRNDLFYSYRLEQGAVKPIGRLMGVIGKHTNS